MKKYLVFVIQAYEKEALYPDGSPRLEDVTTIRLIGKSYDTVLRKAKKIFMKILRRLEHQIMRVILRSS